MVRNVAKCKVCEDIIESKHLHDYVVCKCGEIAIVGGEDHWYAFGKNATSLIRIDEETNYLGGDIQPRSVCNQNAEVHCNSNAKQGKDNEERGFSREELIDILDALAKSIERLPTGARLAPITHADHHDLITLISSIFRAS
jgi:hypothetical protein